MTRAAPTEPEAHDRDHPFGSDLNWLLHRVGAGLGGVQDDIARRHGLSIRAYVVLATVVQSPPTTQLMLGQRLGLDKSGVTSVLDRLEAEELIVRRPAPGDRRARIPVSTPAGQRLVKVIARDIAKAEAELLSELSASERTQLTGLLRRLAFGPFAESAAVSGSCM